MSTDSAEMANDGDGAAGPPGWLQLEVLSLVGLAALTGLFMVQRSAPFPPGVRAHPLAAPLAALSLLIFGRIGLAVLLSLLSLAAGWGIMWVAVLRQIPFVRDIVHNRPGGTPVGQAPALGTPPRRRSSADGPPLEAESLLADKAPAERRVGVEK